MVGDTLDPRLISYLALGELNNNSQFSMITSDFVTTDREIWVVTVPEPGGLLLCAGGMFALLRGGRRRRAP